LGTHFGATSFEASLAKEVEAFFNGERLLWWLEALALMKGLGGSIDTLSSLANWVTVCGFSSFFKPLVLMDSGVGSWRVYANS
jgi:hypothetical protein